MKYKKTRNKTRINVSAITYYYRYSSWQLIASAKKSSASPSPNTYTSQLQKPLQPTISFFFFKQLQTTTTTIDTYSHRLLRLIKLSLVVPFFHHLISLEQICIYTQNVIICPHFSDLKKQNSKIQNILLSKIISKWIPSKNKKEANASTTTFCKHIQAQEQCRIQMWMICVYMLLVLFLMLFFYLVWGIYLSNIFREQIHFVLLFFLQILACKLSESFAKHQLKTQANKSKGKSLYRKNENALKQKQKQYEPLHVFVCVLFSALHFSLLSIFLSIFLHFWCHFSLHFSCQFVYLFCSCHCFFSIAHLRFIYICSSYVFAVFFSFLFFFFPSSKSFV